MEKYSFSAFDQSDTKFGFAGTTGQHNRSQEVATLLHEVEELHGLKEGEWSFRQYKKQLGAPACKGSYNSERKMMRLRTDIKAPLKKALTYLLHPPYGYRNMLERRGGNTNIVEKLGGGAVVAHNHNPGQTVCCCSVASRETVALCALKLPTSNIAIFGMKSIEHPSYPVTDGAYRVNMPLIGLYLEEEGDLVHVETYVAEMDVGGKIGKLGPSKAMTGMVRQMIQIARAIPRMQDVMGEPPYMQLM